MDAKFTQLIDLLRDKIGGRLANMYTRRFIESTTLGRIEILAQLEELCEIANIEVPISEGAKDIESIFNKLN